MNRNFNREYAFMLGHFSLFKFVFISNLIYLGYRLYYLEKKKKI